MRRVNTTKAKQPNITLKPPKITKKMLSVLVAKQAVKMHNPP
ncbi:MAG TPA: hypothetical protein VG347_16045 [Verrucomicrobiae bacterium]|nr:hypothetical protein [Verrucomicrobiae bacterium]